MFFEKKSKIFEICVAVHSEGKNLPGQGMAFRYSSGDIPKSPAENAGKIAGAFKSGIQSNFQDRKRAAGKKICGLGYAVLVDIGNRRCVKVRFEETTKILWIHIEYSSKI